MTPLAEDTFATLRIERQPGVVEWVERALEFSPRVSPNMPGRVSTKQRPYMREPLENTCRHEVTDEAYCWGAQTAKTTTAMLKLAYLLHNDPAPALWVTATEAMGRSWSGSRFQPFVEDNPALAAHKPQNHDDFKLLEMQFDRMTMNIVGSNSPAALASRPIAYLFCDEAAKFAKANKNEASALALAKQRTKTFSRPKRVLTSTPTHDKEEFWEDFLLGDQRYFFLPCPHCREFFRFEHRRETLVWDPAAKNKEGLWDLNLVAKTAHYVCEKCAAPIKDWHKPRMLLEGEWRATNAAALIGNRSYHLNSFYSPDVTFGTMAVEFLKAQAKLFGMQDFLNGWLALPFSDAASEVEEKDLAARRADYQLGTVPDGVEIAAVVLGADVQQAFTNYVVRAFSPTGASWLVDYGRLASVDDLVQWAAAARWTIGGKETKITAGLIDSGWQPEHVYRACASAARLGIRLLPSKGSGERFVAKPVRFTDIVIGGRTYRNSLVIYSDADFKRLLYVERVRDAKEPWFIPDNVGTDYTEEMMRERMITVENTRGYEQLVWKRFGANHYADAEKLALVMWASR